METIGEFAAGMLLAACWLRYAVAPKFGDNFASPTARAAYNFARDHMTSSEDERLWRMLVPIMVPLASSPSGLIWSEA